MLPDESSRMSEVIDAEGLRLRRRGQTRLGRK
jgi:hypothetical protein